MYKIILFNDIKNTKNKTEWMHIKGLKGVDHYDIIVNNGTVILSMLINVVNIAVSEFNETYTSVF